MGGVPLIVANPGDPFMIGACISGLMGPGVETGLTGVKPTEGELTAAKPFVFTAAKLDDEAGRGAEAGDGADSCIGARGVSMEC